MSDEPGDLWSNLFEADSLAAKVSALRDLCRAADDRLATGHRYHAVRAQLLEMAGDTAAAYDAYLQAAQHAASLPHQRFLHGRAARIAPHPPDDGRLAQ